MKILFFNTNIGYGGASKMMADIANALSKNHEVDFLTFRNAEVLQKLDKNVHHVHNELYKNKIKPLENAGQIFALRKYLKNNSYDIAIAFLHPSHYMLTLASVGIKTKVLLSERADPYSRKKNGGAFVHFIERILHHADAFVFQSDGAKALYPPKCKKNSAVIVNSIPDDLECVRFDGERKKTVVHVARMELIQKRQDIMLKAFKIFSQAHPEYILEFYGDGPDEDKMKIMAKELGVADRIEFKGAQKNILKSICDAGMFVLTSDYEGLPNALLEAAAIGLPCISTDCSPGGARMIIEDDYNGFIVPCGDYELLAQRMKEIAEDKEKSEKFSENAIKVKEKFNPQSIYLQWERFIEKIVGY